MVRVRGSGSFVHGTMRTSTPVQYEKFHNATGLVEDHFGQWTGTLYCLEALIYSSSYRLFSNILLRNAMTYRFGKFGDLILVNALVLPYR
jgi:hypothetical protein